jgi:DNA-binding winged helix-turn-helix (wHTH) protein/Tfp pilus assembly protein PilF
MTVYRFGSFVLDVRERRLLRSSQPVALAPKVFDTLAYLVEHHGHLVSKDQLMEAVWAGSFVEDASLPRTIHVIRRALGATEETPDHFIQTVPTKGYRFVAPVTRVTEDSATVVTANPAVAAGAGVGEPRFRRLALLPILILLTLALVMPVWNAVGENDPIESFPSRNGASTDSGAAYARFLVGRVHLERHHPGDVEKALLEFEAAIQLDPGFSDGYAGKADATFFRYFSSGAHDDIAQARLAVRKAIELDKDSPYAHTVSCRLLATYDWEFADAETSCRRAVALDPGNHEARRELAFLLQSNGRPDDALNQMDAAIALAPTSFNKRSRGLLLYFQRRFDEAIAQLQQVEAGDPEYRESSRWIARAFEQKGDYGHALEFLLRFRESAGADAEEMATIRRAFQSGGWPSVLRATLPGETPAGSLDSAGTLAQLGELDSALGMLSAMISARRVMVVHIASEPRLDPLRRDPRFERLVRRVRLVSR